MTDASGDQDRRSVLDDLGESPAGIVVGQPRQRAQGIRFAQRREPNASPASRCALPALQVPQHVEVPQRQGLDWPIEHREPHLGQP